MKFTIARPNVSPFQAVGNGTIFINCIRSYPALNVNIMLKAVRIKQLMQSPQFAHISFQKGLPKEIENTMAQEMY